MSEEEKKGKGGCIGWVVIGLLLIGAVLYGGKELKKHQEGGELGKDLKDPESAVLCYARMVDGIENGRMNPGVKGLLAVVTKDDAKWYMENQEKIYEARQGGFNDFIGYKNPSGGAVEKSMFAIRHLISGSPSRQDILLSVKSNDGKKAVVEAKQGNAYGSFRTYEIDLVKEGKVWKVSGYCGARARFEREFAAAK